VSTNAAEVDITLPARSWLDAARAVAALDGLDETLGDAVWFSAAGSRCAFLVQQDDVVVMVFAGDWHGADVHVPLSPRLVGVAAAAARAGGSVMVRVHEGTTAVVHVGGLQVAVDLVATADIPELPQVEDIRIAVTVDTTSLSDALAVVRAAPIGSDLATVALPPTWIGVEPSRLSVHVDWSAHGAGRATARLDARADVDVDEPLDPLHRHPAGGPADTVAIDSTVLAALVRGLDDEHREVELAFPQRRDGHVRVWAGAWCAWVPCVDATVGRLLPRLTALLADAGLPVDVVGPRTVRFGTPDRRVRGELHGGLVTGPSEVLRLSVVLTHGVEPSLEVLHELNAANAGLVGIRVWLNRDRVVAGLDLPATHLDDVIASVAQLLGQIDGLGPFLGALSPAPSHRRGRAVPIPATPPS